MIGTIIINMIYLKQKFGKSVAAWFFALLIDLAITIVFWILFWVLTHMN